MHLVFIFVGTPPKVCTHGFDLFVYWGRDSEAGHSEGGDSLDHCFDENFLSPFREKSTFPTIQFLSGSVPEVGKLDFLTAYRKRGQTKVQGVSLSNRKAHTLFNVVNIGVRGFRTEQDSRFIEVDLLTGGYFIIPEAIFDSITVVSVSFKEDNVVIGNE